MTRTSRLILLSLIAIALWVAPAAALRPEDQAITIADFQFVNYIATSQAKVYFATTNGIIIYNKIEAHWEQPLTGAEGLSNADVQRIWVDRFDERLFAQTDAGLYEYNFTFERWLSATGVPTINTDDKHLQSPSSLLPPFGFNYLGNGSMVDPEGRTFSITDVVDDGAGQLWVGTWGYGPATASSIGKVVTLLNYGLLQNPSYAMLQEDSILWASGPVLNSRRTGITGVDWAHNKFVYIETGVQSDFPAVDINCLEGSPSSLYAGTSEGLYVLGRDGLHVTKRMEFQHGSDMDNIISLKALGNDSIFIGTADGLLLYQPGKDSLAYLFRSQFSDRVIYDMAVADSFLWIASNVGAFRLSLVTGKLQKYLDPDRVLFNRVFDVHTVDQYMWLASDDGLVRVDRTTGGTKAYHVGSHKLDGRALAVNDKRAFVASERGITMVFLDQDPITTRDFTTDDGLASNYVHSLVLDGDYLWVGTDRGVTRFYWNNPRRVD